MTLGVVETLQLSTKMFSSSVGSSLIQNYFSHSVLQVWNQNFSRMKATLLFTDQQKIKLPAYF